MTLRKLFSTLAIAITTCANAQVTMVVDATQRGSLTSPYQYGLFFEEINHAGDGGLYAELVRNRSFEEGITGWTTDNGTDVVLSMQAEGLLNSAQGVALSLTTSNASESHLCGIRNEGFWGMKFEKNKTYKLSLWAKGNNEHYTGNLVAQLVKSDGKTVIGEARLQGTVYTDKWNKLTAEIQATDTDNSGQLLLLTSNNGRLSLDVVSLFPDTWKDRQNGLRPDLAQLLADTKPTFLRFPGGCYVEGQASFDYTFQWKKTIGSIEQRPGHWNLNWGYWSSDGLGFDEYLQLAEDMGAAPMFVVNVGLGHGYSIPLEDLDTLVQNTLDAIEYANGDGSTYWGAQRIKNGHPAPYNLKFIEIGNENYNFYTYNNNDQSYQYPERYYMFYKAIKEKYPEIVTIGNVEAWNTDAPTWRNDYPVELVDEHYYRTAAWMRDNYNKYDNYPRNIGVYNGEYAANSGDWGKYGNLNAALGEAIYMLGMEKNSDVCRMASFAPIFTHESNPKWAYDMIHFNSGSNFVTPSYHVQKLMASNLGYQNLKWTETTNTVQGTVSHQVGLATWDTQASFKDLKVTQGTMGAELYNGSTTIVIQDVMGDASGWTDQIGNWVFSDGIVSQTVNGEPCRNICEHFFKGSDYTMEVKARKDGGDEAFLIIFDYQDEQNYAWWNIGGWGNTKNAIEVCRNGSKTQYSNVNYSITQGEWYDLKVVVYNSSVKCYINGNLLHEFSIPSMRSLYQSCQLSEDGKEMILKVVNPNSNNQRLVVNTRNMTIANGTVVRLTSEKGTDENTMDNPDKVKPTALEPVSVNSSLTIPAFSLNIFRFPVSNVGEEVPQKTVADYAEYMREDEDKVAYLYAHMHETEEYTCYALKTKDANTWNDLLGSKEVFDTKANTVTGGMRDAFVYRLDDGNGFMLAGTDMTSRLGWESNHVMDLMLTPDLVHWTKNVKIDLETPENLQAIGNALSMNVTAETLTAAWAPQVIYDSKTNKYVLYYSVGIKGDKHYIFYQLIDADLNILTEPRVYFAPGYDVIDADIVYNAVDRQYQMLFKCESTNGFDRATAKLLVPEEGATGTTVWTLTPDFHVGENNQSIEGMTQWRPIGELKWNLSYINYTGGYHYRLRHMDEHGLNVELAGHDISGNVRAQHGSILKLTQKEYDFLVNWDKVSTLLPAVKAFNTVQPTEQHKAAIEAAGHALATTTTFDENATAMAEALKLLEDCPTDTRQILIDKVVKNGSGDLTALIVNADFSEGTKGWTCPRGFTAANGNVAEFYDKPFDYWQDIQGLPNGEYEIGVQAFYRNGGTTGNPVKGEPTAYERYVDGSEQLLAMIYANNEMLPVVSLYSEDGYSGDPYTYADNVATANTAFNQRGQYMNTLRVSVTGGSLTIGMMKNEAVGHDWCCFDNWSLTYLGSGTSINASVRDKESYAIYNLYGQQVKNPERGIYIKGGQKIMK